MAAPGTVYFGSLISVSLAGVVAYGLFKLLGTNDKPESAVDYGRKWLAWMVVIGTFSTLPSFFSHFDADSFARWVIVLVFYGGIAFAAGWVYGKFVRYARGRKAKESQDMERTDTPQSDGPTTPSSLNERLSELAGAFGNGLISEEEYQATRRAILASLADTPDTREFDSTPKPIDRDTTSRWNPKQQQMVELGITHDGRHFCVEERKFDKLSDAVDYAKLVQ